mgnify:CR=1 FL=1
MADVKITEYTELTDPAVADVIEVVDDPAGTPISKKVKLETVLNIPNNWSLIGTDFTLSAATGVQSAFPTTGDVFTLAASTTYEVEGVYFITKSGTTCTTALALALAGGAVLTFLETHVTPHNAAANTTTPTLAGTLVNQVASTVINATAVGEVAIRFKGLIRMAAGGGGTVTPQINFSAAPTTPVMKAGSYISFKRIGTTNNVQGSVA